MKISDLIADLRAVENIHGDVQVYMAVPRIIGVVIDWKPCEAIHGHVNNPGNVAEVPCAKIRAIE